MQEIKNEIPTYVESLRLISRQDCFLEGINEVITVNENLFEGKLKDSKIIIKGTNLHINKLDLSKGFVGLTGNINEIKYSNPLLNKFPRIFR